MSFFAQCPDIGACPGAFQNGANLPAIRQAGVRSNRKQGQVSMHCFEMPTTVHYVGHSKKRHTHAPCEVHCITRPGLVWIGEDIKKRYPCPKRTNN